MPDTVDTSASILQSIKKLLGIIPEAGVFDVDIMIHINTAFNHLTQIGVGPETGYRISSEDNVWTEFTTDNILLENVKSFVYIKVKMAFDPPATSALIDAYNSQLKELEWRIYTQAQHESEEGYYK